MLKGFRVKLFGLVILITIAVFLVLPTFGKKEMDITLSDTSSSVVSEIKKIFPSDNFDFKQNGKTIKISGYKITAALMNEARNAPGVNDAVILPHWFEEFTLKMVKKINLGLDLQGGMNLVLQADMEKLEKDRSDSGLSKLSDADKEMVMAQSLEKINSRVDSTGVAEPIVRKRGSDAIEVQLPGVKNPEEVKEFFLKMGQVHYKFVSKEWTAIAAKYVKDNGIKFVGKDIDIGQLRDEIAKSVGVPDEFGVYFLYEKETGTDNVIPVSVRVLENKIQFQGNDIDSATIGQDQYGGPAVSFKTTNEGSQKFAKATASENRGKQLAIVIDDQVRSDPVINDQISTGQAQITGSFTYLEAQVLASVINEGALPVKLNIIEERTVGPSLGQASINAGFMAILVGLAGVMIFLIIYYKGSGFVADFCLILNMLFMLAIFALLGATLTLPGIAGFILTVGMSVDANVIIYERIKEELRNGKSPRTSVENGYKRAFWTIFDANLTTLIAAFILSQIGTGPIKGFAVTLIIGIICSMFTALYVSKMIFMLITSTKLKKLSI